MSSLENKFLFYCSGNAKSPFTNVVWTRVYEDALCSKHLWKFQGTPVHVYIIYHKIKACNIPRRTTTTAQPVAVNVLHQFLLFVQAVKARTTEAQKVRKPYCTSFSHAPHWFHCDRILFSPCLGWNTNQNYTAILIVGGIALTWSHKWAAPWVSEMKILWSSTVPSHLRCFGKGTTLTGSMPF